MKPGVIFALALVFGSLLTMLAFVGIARFRGPEKKPAPQRAYATVREQPTYQRPSVTPQPVRQYSTPPARIQPARSSSVPSQSINPSSTNQGVDPDLSRMVGDYNALLTQMNQVGIRQEGLMRDAESSQEKSRQLMETRPLFPEALEAAAAATEHATICVRLSTDCIDEFRRIEARALSYRSSIYSHPRFRQDYREKVGLEPAALGMGMTDTTKFFFLEARL